MTENAGPENGGSRLIRGWQILGGKMLHWKTKDQTSLLEKAGPESEGPNCTAWKMKDQANNIVTYKCYAYSSKILVAN